MREDKYSLVTLPKQRAISRNWGFFGEFLSVDEPCAFRSLTSFKAPSRQTIPDFLTSMTSAEERRVRPGFEESAPRSPNEFAERWRLSDERRKLLDELASYEQKHPPEVRMAEYNQSRRAEQVKQQRAKSAYTISYLSKFL